MTRGFVFGKFLPFHTGHEAMIRFALLQCDELTVLVCANKQEPIDGTTRCRWIVETFAGDPRIVVRIYHYDKEILSSSSESSQTASEAWASVFTHVLPDQTVLITSEPYGDYVARAMGIRHIAFDPARNLVPVCASAILHKPMAHWNFLPESVRPFFAKKVVLLGTESTGKSTLAAQLSVYFGATLVTESARDLIDDSTEFCFDDLYLVVSRHAQQIKAAMRKGSALLIIDTDIHITQSYAQHFFGKTLVVRDEIREWNRADLYLYLNNDVPYVQDGTRLSEEVRNELDGSHRLVAEKEGLRLIEIRGNWEQRFRDAVIAVRSLIGN